MKAKGNNGFDAQAFKESGKTICGIIEEAITLVTPNYDTVSMADVNLISMPVIRYIDENQQEQRVLLYPINLRASYYIQHRDLYKNIEVVFEPKEFQPLVFDLEQGIFNGKQYCSGAIEQDDSRKLCDLIQILSRDEIRACKSKICIYEQPDLETYMKGLLVGNGMVVKVTGENYLYKNTVNYDSKTKNTVKDKSVSVRKGIITVISAFILIIVFLFSANLFMWGASTLEMIFVGIIILLTCNILPIVWTRLLYPVVILGNFVNVKSDGEVKYPIYEYKYQGVTYRHRNMFGTNFGIGKVGKAVMLRINPDNPYDISDGSGGFTLAFFVELLILVVLGILLSNDIMGGGVGFIIAVLLSFLLRKIYNFFLFKV